MRARLRRLRARTNEQPYPFVCGVFLLHDHEMTSKPKHVSQTLVNLESQERYLPLGFIYFTCVSYFSFHFQDFRAQGSGSCRRTQHPGRSAAERTVTAVMPVLAL